jgi:hypothetical protein
MKVGKYVLCMNKTYSENILKIQDAEQNDHVVFTEVIAIINCDDKMELYADGVQIGKDNGKWFMSKIYKIPAAAKVVAIHGFNVGGPAGIIGSFSTGLLTDSSWRCTNKKYPKWQSTAFDDSAWPGAEVVRRNDKLKGPAISKEAKWIWTSRNTDMNVYCRSALGKCILIVYISHFS